MKTFTHRPPLSIQTESLSHITPPQRQGSLPVRTQAHAQPRHVPNDVVPQYPVEPNKLQNRFSLPTLDTAQTPTRRHAIHAQDSAIGEELSILIKSVLPDEIEDSPTTPNSPNTRSVFQKRMNRAIARQPSLNNDNKDPPSYVDMMKKELNANVLSSTARVHKLSELIAKLPELSSSHRSSQGSEHHQQLKALRLLRQEIKKQDFTDDERTHLSDELKKALPHLSLNPAQSPKDIKICRALETTSSIFVTGGGALAPTTAGASLLGGLGIGSMFLAASRFYKNASLTSPYGLAEKILTECATPL